MLRENQLHYVTRLLQFISFTYFTSNIRSQLWLFTPLLPRYINKYLSLAKNQNQFMSEYCKFNSCPTKFACKQVNIKFLSFI